MIKPIIAIVGPTGVGKTRLSIAIAKKFNSEIISCDSMQFYRGLDIGTAKITETEKSGIIHHLIDILNPDDEFSVAIYQNIVRSKIAELHARNLIPVLVGGSGLYISSILYDYKFLGEKRDEKLEVTYKNYTTLELAELLKESNPSLANKTDLKNRRRVLRALEKSDDDFEHSGEKLYYENSLVIGLDMDRDKLYEIIDNRVDIMIEKGLVDEAKNLYRDYLDTQAAMAIGYKELFHYFENKTSLEQAIELIKKNSRHYAKRQLTWFRNKMDCFWIEVDLNNFDKTIEEAFKIVSYL